MPTANGKIPWFLVTVLVGMLAGVLTGDWRASKAMETRITALESAQIELTRQVQEVNIGIQRHWGESERKFARIETMQAVVEKQLDRMAPKSRGDGQ